MKGFSGTEQVHSTELSDLAGDIKTMGECNFTHTNVDSVVEQVARNNSKNNGDRHKVRKKFSN